MTNSGESHAEWIRNALQRYEQPLVHYAARITGDLELARDVVQDTFLKLCRADRKALDGRVAPWLYTVCRNRALDVRKKERRMQPLREGQAEAVPSRDAAPNALAERHEAQRLVLEAVDTLPEHQQEVFRLKFQQGLTYREISRETGVSIATVSNYMHAALEAVRQSLAVYPEVR